MEHFRWHDLFRSSSVVNIVESDTTDWESGTASFSMTLYQSRRAGARND